MEFFLTLMFTLITSSFGFYNQNEDCSQDGGKIRECKEISYCATAKEEIKQGKYPDLCGFADRIPLVCCTKNSENIRLSNISEIQCKKYEEISQKNLVFAITGGDKIFDYQYPHMAALGFGPDNSKTWQCGGTLISEKFILTAAHCLVSNEVGPVRWIRLGGLNIANLNETNAQTFKVGRAIMHPDYRPPSVYHDVALLELDREVQFNAYIKPACLHKNEPVLELAATGWGLVEFNGEQSDQLQRVYLDEFSTESCKNSYKDIANTKRLKQGIIEELQLCAGSKTEVKDTCPGDSGGPLQAWRKGGYLYNVVGITSFGKGCGIVNVPGVYTRVSSYVPWIETIVWSELLN